MAENIEEILKSRGFEPVGKSGMYEKKTRSTKDEEGVLKVNVKAKVAMFATKNDAYETYSEVPELAEIQELLHGKQENKPGVAKAFQEAATQGRAPPAKESAPTRNLPAKVDPASSVMPSTAKDFMHEVGAGTPKELAVSLGVGDKAQKYATNRGLWYAFYALGLKLKSCKLIHDHWSWQKGEDDPRSGEAWVRSEIIIDDGTPNGQYYEAWGDATVKNVKLEDVQKALDRMAETRAEDRCLRKITAGGWRVKDAQNMTSEQQEVFNNIKACEQCSAEELAHFGGEI